MAMENTLAPNVVMPPWASSKAWNSSTMVPSTAMTEGPNRIEPRPVPVGWEQLPVTEGSFKADKTNVKALQAASNSLARGYCFTTLATRRALITTNGRETAVQA